MKLELPPNIVATWRRRAIAAIESLANQETRPDGPPLAAPPDKEIPIRLQFHFELGGLALYDIRPLARATASRERVPRPYTATVSEGVSPPPARNTGACYLFCLKGRSGDIATMSYYQDPQHGCARMVEQKAVRFEHPAEAEEVADFMAAFFRAVTRQMELPDPSDPYPTDPA